MWQVKSVARWTHKLAMRSPFLAGTATLLAPLVLAPSASAQVNVGIGIQPVCSYGYYNYAPYGCAPSGFYGPGYFYSGVFLGVGPWANWGHGHGWGKHRFNGAGGGRYVAGRGNGHVYARGPAGVRGHAVAAHGNAAHGESCGPARRSSPRLGRTRRRRTSLTSRAGFCRRIEGRHISATKNGPKRWSIFSSAAFAFAQPFLRNFAKFHGHFRPADFHGGGGN